MPRLDLPADDAMTEAQKAAVAEAVAGIRGRVPAPMVAWLQNPELASRAQKLGELLRYRTSLEPRLSELAILVCGRHWTSHHEWTAHKREGLKAGLDPKAIDAIAARRTPVLSDAREQAVYDVSTTLLATGRVPPPLYRQGVTTLGERGMVELVGILGYYCLVALTLNTFELGLPGSVAPELEDPEFSTGAA
ncbi:carboxymuconolactone decarboxylase family protein [Neoroseomonas lacus]|uniref:4-carboxymuconolactone decarboxylase n=1 Tax=Neoroseomonas lacus TaxID=287609 RepID=A0A917KKH1_9PROT|nr:carboxymuconolactone decarboxylase family protein [Neoroseomonas lacus]GGJ17893.1 4-carboxymuconolactone decarboxylase [Neoroseomonas lacus]